MWITVYHCGMKCYTILTKWEKVEVYVFSIFSLLRTHEHMRIIHTIHKVVGHFGTFEITKTQIKGLRLRKVVLVKK